MKFMKRALVEWSFHTTFMKRAFGEFHKCHMKLPRVILGSIAFKMDIISIRKHTVQTDVDNDVRCTRQSVHVWACDFYDTALSADSNMTLTFSPLSV